MFEKEEKMKQNDQIELLKNCQKFTDTEEWCGIFSYPNCGWDLVQQKLATEDKKITIAGRAVLWFLGKGPDPTDSKVCETFELKLTPNEVSEKPKSRDLPEEK